VVGDPLLPGVRSATASVTGVRVYDFPNVLLLNGVCACVFVWACIIRPPFSSSGMRMQFWLPARWRFSGGGCVARPHSFRQAAVLLALVRWCTHEGVCGAHMKVCVYSGASVDGADGRLHW
jgi:hypothetical protein